MRQIRTLRPTATSMLLGFLGVRRLTLGIAPAALPDVVRLAALVWSGCDYRFNDRKYGAGFHDRRLEKAGQRERNELLAGAVSQWLCRVCGGGFTQTGSLSAAGNRHVIRFLVEDSHSAQLFSAHS
jgi:hypothetical protein